jgi:hypothetical protein
MTAIPATAIWAVTSLAAVAMICLTALKIWRGWLELKRDEAGARHPAPPEREPAARIEMADVRERLRKLEAIARGVDL